MLGALILIEEWVEYDRRTSIGRRTEQAKGIKASWIHLVCKSRLFTDLHSCSLVVTHRESLLKELFILVGQPEEHSDNVLRFLQGRNDESKHDPETWHTFLRDQSLG